MAEKAKNLKIDVARSKVTLEYANGDIIDVPVPKFHLPPLATEEEAAWAVVGWMQMAANAAHDYHEGRVK